MPAFILSSDSDLLTAAVPFLLGGFLVSFFGFLGDLLRPRSLSGILGAAPSIALATLWITIRKYSAAYAAIEARSMLIGAIAFAACTFVAFRLLWSHRTTPARAAWIAIAAWFVTAGTLGLVLLRPNG